MVFSRPDREIHAAGAQPSQHEMLNERVRVARRSTWVSIWVNLFLSTMQVAIGFIAHSQALVADGLHSLSDLLADFVVLWANKVSHKAPDDDHPYGHLRFETAASMLLGVLLMIVAAGMLWLSLQRIVDASSIPTVSSIALAMAVLTLCCKELLFRYMLAAGKRVKSSLLIANAWHARSDAASSLVVALGIAGNLMGYSILDPIAALLVGLVIMRMGWRFAYDALQDLMDRGLEQSDLDAMTHTLAACPGVLGVHDIKARKMGDMVLVEAHLEVDRHLTVQEGHDIAMRARSAILEHHPKVLNLLTHIDPVDPSPLMKHESDGSR